MFSMIEAKARIEGFEIWVLGVSHCMSREGFMAVQGERDNNRHVSKWSLELVRAYLCVEVYLFIYFKTF